jgi:ABC-type transport system involved in cytochrome bd biosynthesis fused ATPase/permease subunit
LQTQEKFTLNFLQTDPLVLEKKYKNLEKIEFFTGKINVLIGASGTGKSTLLQNILLNPFFCELTHDSKSTFNIQNLKVLFLAQEPYIIPSQVAENALYPKTKINLKSIELAKKALQIVELDKTIHDSVIGLSGGEKQKLALSRVFCSSYDLIVIDEGTSALDEVLERKILNHLEKVAKEAIVVLVSHRQTYKLFNYNAIELKDVTV